MQAIVHINGNQVQVEEGRYVHVHAIEAKPNEELIFDQVLFVLAGEHSVVGAPFIEGAKVTAKVVRHFRDKKILVYKMNRKKGYRRKYGHRQPLTELQIVDVSFPSKAQVAPHSPKTEAKPKPVRKAEAKPAAAEKPAKKEPKAATVEAPPKTAEKTAEAKPAKKEGKAEGESAAAKKPAAAKKKATPAKAASAKADDAADKPAKKAATPKAKKEGDADKKPAKKPAPKKKADE